MSELEKLQAAIETYAKLMEYSYHIVGGKAGKKLDLTIEFDESDFHHLLGLQYLHDIEEVAGSGTGAFTAISSNDELQRKIIRSADWDKIKDRVESLAQFDTTMAEFQEVYRYNKSTSHSKINASFILKHTDSAHRTYICIDHRDRMLFAKSQFRRTISEPDYCRDHTRYTLLLNERTHKQSRVKEILYQIEEKGKKQTTNIVYPHFQPLPRADVLATADRLPQQKSILERLRDLVSGIAAKIRQAFSSPAQQRPASKQRHAAAPAQRRTTEPDKGTSDRTDRSAQDRAHGEPQQAAAKTAHTISHAKRSVIKAQAQRAGHTDKAHHRGVQAHSHDDELS